ncbi:unnamed protein product [Cercopithifilaria johnstoni]|uniref:Uncharacterized protein n=1 Tax=Cercopithifilaria johnstoni TaxID=2874296 RepID=A0A8J2MR15_9BILA|nr:unnamed protein product [Cercopithifilaria johnstoni]
MDDNLADYRRFCANRLKRLERCKKTKSFCNLDDEIPHILANSGSDLMLRGSEILPSYGGSRAFSRFSKNVAPSSFKSDAILSCLGTSTFCSESNTSPKTDDTRFGSTEVLSVNVVSPIAEVNLSKSSSLIADSWLQNNRKCTPVTSNFDSPHLPLSSCSSFITASTTTVSSQPSQCSMLSTNKPESEMRIAINNNNNNNDNNNDHGDSNRSAQRNFDLLREKMVKFCIIL